MWPWNAATLFLSLILPLKLHFPDPERPCGKVVEGVYLRPCWKLGVRPYVSRPLRCAEGVPDTPAFLWSSRQRGCLLSQPVVSPHTRPCVTWPTPQQHPVTLIRPPRSEGLCTPQRSGRTWADVQGLEVGVGVCFFLGGGGCSGETDPLSNMFHEGQIKCLGVKPARI